MSTLLWPGNMVEFLLQVIASADKMQLITEVENCSDLTLFSTKITFKTGP